jgi:hypothetical protein
MWESRFFCEISKERWEEGKSCFWISTLSTVPPFPQLFFMALSSRAPAFVHSPFAMGGWPGAASASVAAAAALLPPAAVWPGALRFPRELIAGHRNGFLPFIMLG